MKVSKNCSVGGLWDELNQGLFPWIDDNIGELEREVYNYLSIIRSSRTKRSMIY